MLTAVKMPSVGVATRERCRKGVEDGREESSNSGSSEQELSGTRDEVCLSDVR
jgi:hypothetical protein